MVCFGHGNAFACSINSICASKVVLFERNSAFNVSIIRLKFQRY